MRNFTASLSGQFYPTCIFLINRLFCFFVPSNLHIIKMKRGFSNVSCNVLWHIQVSPAVLSTRLGSCFNHCTGLLAVLGLHSMAAMFFTRRTWLSFTRPPACLLTLWRLRYISHFAGTEWRC